jgi:hypothetical protein
MTTTFIEDISTIENITAEDIVRSQSLINLLAKMQTSGYTGNLIEQLTQALTSAGTDSAIAQSIAQVVQNHNLLA